MGRIAIAAATLAITLVPLAAQAQTAPISRTITLTYTGTVTNAAADTIKVRQPDGSYVPYTGPLPDLPYANGDAVSISFNATMPTKAFYDSGVYQGQVAADGIYRIRVSTYPTGGTSQLGYAGPSDVSGPISYSPNYGEPPFTSMALVYDYNTDSYSIDGGGNYLATAMWGPGYVFDAAGNLVACQFQTCAPPQYDYNSFALRGGADGSTITATNIGIYNPVNGDSRAGLWNLGFTGSWNLPKFGSSGPISVPEPSMLILFGGGAAFAMARRRRRAALPA